MREEIAATAREDAAVPVFASPTGVGTVEVDAFRRRPDLAMRKSLRDDFSSWRAT